MEEQWKEAIRSNTDKYGNNLYRTDTITELIMLAPVALRTTIGNISGEVGYAINSRRGAINASGRTCVFLEHLNSF